MSLPGYELGDVLTRSDRTIVKRALRHLDGRKVVVKQLALPYASLDSQRRLAFEYHLLSKLRGPGVVEAVELLSDGGRLALVLEDFDAVNLASASGARLPLSLFFDVALHIARALGRVHAHRVIHKDIKPHNLLWNRESGELKIIDFQLATELSSERPDIAIGNQLEGSLPYISPEQTGRMNRAVDFRSDYYSLGVTLFQLLTGELPFNAEDVMGWVHAHISLLAPLASEVCPEVPPVLSRVVARLLEKDPDDRYQSIAGLESDLRRCKEQWQSSDRIPDFELGQDDISERFQLSQRLIGREQEVSKLLEALEDSSRGAARLLLITGYSGVGKSSLIREVHKPITAKTGRFVSGKFDQLDRSMPYRALVQAVGQLVREILAESDEELRRWKTRILEALGANAQVMIDLVPELERVVGRQVVAPQLNPSEAKNRFWTAFREFIRLFTTSESPLVLFLDDLQWTDASTPELLSELLVRGELGHILIIAAYRDNEIREGHLLPKAIKRIREARPDAVSEVSLRPLREEGVGQLIADSLRQPLDQIRPLAALIFAKTAGNPFFATQLLQELHRNGAIFFDSQRHAWSFDLDQARLASITDNVVDLLVARMRELPADVLEVLSAASCLGNRFDLGAVAQLVEKSTSEVAGLLWQPSIQGLIIPIGDAYRLAQNFALGAEGTSELDASAAYRFQHDRVQQAAHSLVDARSRAAMHLKIGRKLVADLGNRNMESTVFDVVKHLNYGKELISDQEERQGLVDLNVRAAQMAIRSTAFAIAREYLDTATGVFSDEEWATRPRQWFQIRQRLAEAMLMAGDPEKAAEACDSLFALAYDDLSRASVHLLNARILESQARFVDAVGAARAGLELFDIELPENPEEIGQRIRAGIGRMQEHLAKVGVEQLLDLPDLEDPEKILAMNLLFQAIPSAIQTNPPLFILAELTMFDLAVRHGLAPFSAKNFVDCGIIQNGIIGDADAAYRLGKVAFKILERYDAKAIASSVNFVFATYVSSWRAPHQEALAAFEECYRVGMETGDIQHMGFGTALRLHRLLHVGHDLHACRGELIEAIAFLESSRLVSQRTAVIQIERAIARLCDVDVAPKQLSEGDEQATAAVLATQNPQWIYAYGESQLVVSVLLGDFDTAERWRRLAEPYVESATSLISVPEYRLCELLIRTRYKWDQASEVEKAEIIEFAREVKGQLAKLSANCPENFAHKFHLAAAELARIESAPLESVLEHYQLAGECTGPSYIQWRALALELQAAFWRGRRQVVFALALLREAQMLYRRWGAEVKAQQLGELLLEQTGVRAPIPEHGSRQIDEVLSSQRQSQSAVARGDLDLDSILKATRAVSSEVRPDKLYSSLMSTILENAAAQRSSLILPQDGSGELTVEAQADIMNSEVVVASTPLSEAKHVCRDIVRYVARCQSPLVIDDARAHDLFGRDEYVNQGSIKSVLCLPVMNQGKLAAVLYSENNATTHAFPSRRVATLQLIAAQAAISIVNARLYEGLEQKVEERTRELATKNREIVAMLDGMDQGVLSIDRELRILPQLSRRVPELLGTEEVAGSKLLPMLFAGADLSEDKISAAEACLMVSFGTDLEFASLNFSHLITEFSRREADGTVRHFEVDWKAIAGADEAVEKFIVVVRDVTELRLFRESETRRAWEAEVVSQILSSGIGSFRDFCSSTRDFLKDIPQTQENADLLRPEDLAGLARSLHTVKGNARYLGLSRLVDEAHETEKAFVKPTDGSNWRVDGPQLIERSRTLEATLAAHEEVAQRRLGQLWTDSESRLKRALEGIDKASRPDAASPFSAEGALREIRRVVDQVNCVPLAEVVEETARGFSSLALELNKPVPAVECSDNGTRLTSTWGRVVKNVLTHCFRNSLDHGIEPVNERQALGKTVRGCIKIEAERIDGRARLRLSDDGRGLPLQRLREQNGNIAHSDRELADSVFSAGVTTARSLTQISGRGIGLDAVRSFMQEHGGGVALAFTGEEASGFRPFELIFELPPEAIHVE